MANFKNFDAMLAQMKHETIPFQIFGKNYEIKKRIPAVVVLEMARHEESEAIPNKVLIEAGMQIFGKAIMDDLCKHEDFSVDVLSEMIKWAFEVINGTEEEPEAVTEDDIGVLPEKN